MNTLDREYIGRQAKEMKQLEAENKALKETLGQTTDLVVDYQERMVEIQQSRVELLEAVCQSEIVFRNTGHKDKAKMLVPIIKKAQAQKEKETNE